MIVITSFKVGTFVVNGLLGHLLNVNKDIYDFFPWKKKYREKYSLELKRMNFNPNGFSLL